jgi:oligoendopeptidase F
MKTQFITNDSGKKIAVILPISRYRKMIEELEDLEDIKVYDEAKKDNEPSIPIDEAFEMIEKKRKAK